MRRFLPSAGIAIGPILFVVAMLGIIATIMSSSGGSSFGSAGTADRVTADIAGQANLIRAKIAECHMQYLVNGTNYASAPCAGDPYPCSDQTNGTAVSDLTCPNDPLDGANERSIWTGLRPASLPQASNGFNNWMYINAGSAGGRCIWTAPTSGNGTAAIVEGLKRVATKFTTEEIAYDDSSNTQKVVIFITRPTGVTNSNCTVP